jgi:hypothetical protein
MLYEHGCEEQFQRLGLITYDLNKEYSLGDDYRLVRLTTVNSPEKQQRLLKWQSKWGSLLWQQQ